MRSAIASVFLAFGIVVADPAAATRYTVEVEAGYVIPGYNDVAIPGDTGTRLSLTDDLSADRTAAYRIRVGRTLAERHWIAFLAAPLTAKSEGTPEGDVDYNGAFFPGGERLDATFRFDSYRLVYRYRIIDSPAWRIDLGGAAKIRDAAIRLEGSGVASEKKNTGFVPLLSFAVAWKPADRLRLLADGEALAAPQGRAEDVLFAVRYEVDRRVALSAGYRFLEGGADNDEVYTFSLFHYLTAGAVFSF
jgi:hypothetical protein